MDIVEARTSEATVPWAIEHKNSGARDHASEPWASSPRQVTTGLSVRVLHTAAEKQSIAHLRQYADSKSEYEFDPGMAALETSKDRLGIVMAIDLIDKPIATIRFIPTGHGVTFTERFWYNSISSDEIRGPDGWEVGRLVMAPESRTSDLLPKCLALALVKLVQIVNVNYLHATCRSQMVRLHRRFGFQTLATAQSNSGKECALIYGHVPKVAAALKVSIEPTFQNGVSAELALMQQTRVTVH